jgi:hydroxymethylpyrimidine/phosphomethylpyrimidine kinase
VLGGDRIPTGNDHGTGCSLSAAIASRMALGDDAVTAVRAAKRFVADALEGAAGWRLGSGHGPIDHFGWERGGRSVGGPAGGPDAGGRSAGGPAAPRS